MSFGRRLMRCARPLLPCAARSEVCDQGVCGDITDPRNRCQQIVGSTPDRRSSDSVINVVIELGELSTQVLSVVASIDRGSKLSSA